MKRLKMLICLVMTAAFLFGCVTKPAEETIEETDRQYEIAGPAVAPAEDLLIMRIPNLGMEEGDAGRFSVNGYTAKLRVSGIDHVLSQKIVNEEDSAWLYQNLPGMTMVIADHYYQGFEAIKDSIPGETVAYLAKDGTVTAYRCVSIYPDSQNLGGDLVLSDGRVVQREICDGPMATYTCNDEIGISVTVVFWEPVMTMSVIRPGADTAQ